MNNKFIVPKSGLKVPNPTTGQPLAQDGEEVEFDTYWQRRQNDGDISIKRKPTNKKGK